MKKLTLNKINFAGATELTREQLKKVMGGDGMFTTIGPGDPYTTTGNGDVPSCADGMVWCICPSGREIGCQIADNCVVDSACRYY